MVSVFPMYEVFSQYKLRYSDTGKYSSVSPHNMTFNNAKNNNVSFESLYLHYDQYHILSYWTHCDTSDNVCLDLQN